ncbi:VOC family protein [Microvirga brassicacearum]|uniref:2-oxoadipate dioxygenase/decarboxylase n=1 Tax=Microvirga brassicacearum TaxID=2580413 RepID=A0A5N3P5Z2_9HYPH|nr:VOC family protein [Microvirga brassicacearum]KAB0265133.1 VOC family protein [Microvirga brassicacearum]
MTLNDSVSSDDVRTMFSRAMSDMYRAEVPQYGTLMELVADVNASTLAADPQLRERLARADELDRLDLERHGAIRLGTAGELATMRRLFAVMGMVPVGYYDLSVAGVPVHSTAFRPIDNVSLGRNPFRVFTSLLRLELIEDEDLRTEAQAVLERRRIFTPGALRLIERFEEQGRLTRAEAEEFVREALETFRWHSEATVDADTHGKLLGAHRLIADVVSFKGPHINHLTPRTLDIDAVQVGMPERGITAKAVIEGPPTRACPILLRQTSFKALEEPILFTGEGQAHGGTHTARFGEIEQRGIALTRKGRTLYDELLASVRDEGAAGSSSADYASRLAEAFLRFPDSYEEIRAQELGFFRYSLMESGTAADLEGMGIDGLIAGGRVKADPIVYEDFLPVSAAGIFQSNLGGTEQRSYSANANRDAFEAALGAAVLDEFDLYEDAQTRSLEAVRAALRDGRCSSDA